MRVRRAQREGRPHPGNFASHPDPACTRRPGTRRLPHLGPPKDRSPRPRHAPTTRSGSTPTHSTGAISRIPARRPGEPKAVRTGLWETGRPSEGGWWMGGCPGTRGKAPKGRRAGGPHPRPGRGSGAGVGRGGGLPEASRPPGSTWTRERPANGVQRRGGGERPGPGRGQRAGVQGRAGGRRGSSLPPVPRGAARAGAAGSDQGPPPPCGAPGQGPGPRARPDRPEEVTLPFPFPGGPAGRLALFPLGPLPCPRRRREAWARPAAHGNSREAAGSS